MDTGLRWPVLTGLIGGLAGGALVRAGGHAPRALGGAFSPRGRWAPDGLLVSCGTPIALPHLQGDSEVLRLFLGLCVSV